VDELCTRVLSFFLSCGVISNVFTGLIGGVSQVTYGVRMTRVTINVMSRKYELVPLRKPKIKIRGAPTVGGIKVRLFVTKSMASLKLEASQSNSGCAACSLFCVFTAQCNIVRDVAFDALLPRARAWSHLVAKDKRTVSTQLTTQDPRNCLGLFKADPQWVKTVHNVCGLACILGMTGPTFSLSFLGDGYTT